MSAEAGFKAKVEMKIDAAQAPFTELRSASLKIGAKEIDVSTIDSEWEKKLSGQKNWSMTLECFYDPADTVQQAALDALLSGDEVEVYYYPLGKIATMPVYSGKARVTDTEIPAKTNEGVTLPLTLAGNGALSPGIVSA